MVDAISREDGTTAVDKAAQMPVATTPAEAPQAVSEIKHKAEIARAQMAADMSVVIAREQAIDLLFEKKIMKNGIHYGEIPGTKGRKCLLQAGAQKLMTLFQMRPQREVEEIKLPGDHREYKVRTKLISMVSGQQVGEGHGSASTMEAKYRYRIEWLNDKPVPKEWWTTKDPMVLGGPEYEVRSIGSGKFKTYKIVRKHEHPDPFDYHNTALKMACKRSEVHATIDATATSDRYTSDKEDWTPSMRPDDNSEETHEQLEAESLQESQFKARHVQPMQAAPEARQGLDWNRGKTPFQGSGAKTHENAPGSPVPDPRRDTPEAQSSQNVPTEAKADNPKTGEGPDIDDTPNRRITKQEYDEMWDHARNLGATPEEINNYIGMMGFNKPSEITEEGCRMVVEWAEAQKRIRDQESGKG